MNVTVAAAYGTANVFNVNKVKYDWRLDKFNWRGEGCMEFSA